MRKIMIVSGHGGFATGLQSSIELLAGPNEDVYFIDFTVDDTGATLKEKYINVINASSDSEILFICDILGGTPFKTAAEIANDKDNMEVVVGCNVGSIIEAILQKDTMTLDQLAEEIVRISKQSTVWFHKVILEQINNDNPDTEDGI